MKTTVIIPALNEEGSIGLVLDALPAEIVHKIIVVDNGSTDSTADIAVSKGAHVVNEPVRGYGQACLAGIAALDENTDIVAFLDADFSDNPAELTNVIRPITEDGYDMVIGSRVLGTREKGALLPQARFGNWLSTWLIRLLYRFNYTDLGPFRAIRYDALTRLNMDDRNFGWTVQMQVRALKHDLKVTEVPVSYKKRIGKSKITGTVKGTFLAGYKIIFTIFREFFKA